MTEGNGVVMMIEKTIADHIISTFKLMTPEQRLDTLTLVAAVYCPHCGHPQPEPPAKECQCWNDD